MKETNRAKGAHTRIRTVSAIVLREPCLGVDPGLDLARRDSIVQKLEIIQPLEQLELAAPFVDDGRLKQRLKEWIRLDVLGQQDLAAFHITTAQQTWREPH